MGRANVEKIFAKVAGINNLLYAYANQKVRCISHMRYWVHGIAPVHQNEKADIYEILVLGSTVLTYICIPSWVGISETRIIQIEGDRFSTNDLTRRYSIMTEKDKSNIEEIKSEIEDDYSDDSLFNISSWGADLSFRELISMYEDDELVKPELQRKYVWDKTEASRFIESILLGLPVPSIFLAQSGSQKLIVDGYQRIMTVYDYVKRGIFSADGKVFKLSNSEKINQRWRNKAFTELSVDDQRKIRSTTIHAIIFEQKKPENDDTSLYQIFERINTSGRSLTPQEIRNCVYQGTFNSMLFELNENETWRKLFGTADPDSRMRDIEYILRFFVMKTDKVLNSDANQISLKKSLNTFMDDHKNDSADDLEEFKNEFLNTIQLVNSSIGENAFRNITKTGFSKKFHPAIFDAIMVSAFLSNKKGHDIRVVSPAQHQELLSEDQFKNAISKRTTNIESIKKRIQLASAILFGVDINEE